MALRRGGGQTQRQEKGNERTQRNQKKEKNTLRVGFHFLLKKKKKTAYHAPVYSCVKNEGICVRSPVYGPFLSAASSACAVAF